MEKLCKLILEALQLPEAEVKDIHRVGGMTNYNYLATINGEEYVARIPGNGTAQFINRKEEKENLEFSSLLGINPELLYFNAETGLKITRKVIDATTLTSELAKQEEIMKEVVEIFKKLHYSEVPMKNRFRLFTLMDNYEKLARGANATFFVGFNDVKRDVLALKAHYDSMKIEESPCHIDPACGNFIKDRAGRVYLIDWEYSGMFDSLWDLAGYSMESGFSASEEELFLKIYFQRDVTKLEAERILMHKIFQDYLWSLWTLFKETKGDDFGTYGRRRYERLKSNVVVYKSNFDC